MSKFRYLKRVLADSSGYIHCNPSPPHLSRRPAHSLARPEPSRQQVLLERTCKQREARAKFLVVIVFRPTNCSAPAPSTNWQVRELNRVKRSRRRLTRSEVEVGKSSEHLQQTQHAVDFRVEKLAEMSRVRPFNICPSVQVALAAHPSPPKFHSFIHSLVDSFIFERKFPNKRIFSDLLSDARHCMQMRP